MIGRVLAGLIATACILGIGWGALSSDDNDLVTTQTNAAAQAQSSNAQSSGAQSSSAQPPDEQAPEETDEQAAPLGPAPENFGPAGTLTNLDGWLQTDATSLEDFDGQVKVLQFWTFSCHNCTATIPTLQHLYETYHDDGLQIIGVHAPEFSFEEDPDAVLQAAQDLGVTWPIAIDNNKRNFRSWQGSRRFWPRTYVIDANGDIRFDHIGEGAYEELEETVAYLLQTGGA